MNSIGVKLPVAQEFGKKSINLHHFGTKYNHPNTYPQNLMLINLLKRIK